MNFSYGLNNYKQCKLDYDINDLSKSKNFTTVINEEYIDEKLDIFEILLTHIDTSKKLEILYSGGLDSELVLFLCKKFNLNYKIVTIIIKYKGMICNTHDLYYSEKFCRENGLKQNFIDLEVTSFFENGIFLEYLEPYLIKEINVAIHFYALTQCDTYPILGGDWHWVQNHEFIETPVLSPVRHDYSYYDLFMKNNNITGIGNMLGYSFPAAYRFIQLFLKHYTKNLTADQVKFKMYSTLFNTSVRFRSMGLERIPPYLFNKDEYIKELEKKFGFTTHNIVWGNKIKELINSNTYTNNKF